MCSATLLYTTFRARRFVPIKVHMHNNCYEGCIVYALAGKEISRDIAMYHDWTVTHSEH